jgi:GTP cyclohydrolase IA
VRHRAVVRAIEQLLWAIGEDPAREGLRDTPERVARFWSEFIDHDAGNVETVFQSQTTNQLVAVGPIRVWSLCEHHLLPFWCDVRIGYLASDRILGLSKFARIAQKYAHRLQIQERLVEQIADEVCRLARSENVAVVATGLHLCMAMRGARSEALMTSSAMRGVFREDHDLRHEFLMLTGAGRTA